MQAIQWEKCQGGGGGGDDGVGTVTQEVLNVSTTVSTGGSGAEQADEAPQPAASEGLREAGRIGDAAGGTVPDSSVVSGGSPSAAGATGTRPSPTATAAADVSRVACTTSPVNAAATVGAEAAGQGEAQPAGAQRQGVEGDGSGHDSGDDDGSDEDGSHDEENEAMEARLRRAAVELSSPAVVKRVGEKLEGYRLPPERLERLRETLRGFLGTKNYHNYTNHKHHSDPSCKRRVFRWRQQARSMPPCCWL